MTEGDLYTLEQLDGDLYDLALKLYDMKALEQAIDEFWASVAVDAIPLVGPWLNALYDKYRSAQDPVIIGSDAAVLADLPDRCRYLVGIDPVPYQEATVHFEATALDMVGIEGAPGNILGKIGNWYGDAAEAFEEYFAGYSPAQARQAELFAATINASASLEATVRGGQQAVRDLLTQALSLADQMIDKYKGTQKALEVNLAIGVAGIAAAGFGIAAAGGAAAALGGAVSSGAGSLVSSIYAFNQTYSELSASDSDELVESMSVLLVGIESAVHDADEGIATEIETIRSEWTMREMAIPAPPGADEVNTESFHHESAV